jgi:predicted AlkP superfamily phosphohydrolase/phosphomutase
MYPPDFKFNFNLKKLEVEKRIPRTKFEFRNYFKKKQRIVRNEFDFGKKMLTNYNWDIFFLYTSALDSIMHIFWNYCNPDDPTYPGPNPFQNAIKDFHILHDNLIGEMLTHVDSNTAVILFSDHGHYMRPINLFNINEVLRKEGLLFAKDGIIAPVYNSKEKIKRWAVNIAQKSGLRPAAQTILRIFPSIKKMYTNPSTIDFDRTIAHCIDLSGMKSYSYGGITIAKEKLKSESEYIKVKNRIVKILSRWEIPGTSEKAVEWIEEKEELYHGPYIDKYPDIVFNLKDRYGAGWAIKVPIFSKTVAHKFYPGSHRGSTPIFYMLNPGDKECIKRDITLMDIAPTILDLIDINWKEFDFDGESIFK